MYTYKNTYRTPTYRHSYSTPTDTPMHTYRHACLHTPTNMPTHTGTPTAHLQAHLQHSYRYDSLILSMKTVRPTLGRNHRSPRSHHILCGSLASLCPRHNPLGLPDPACYGGQPESQQPALSKPVMVLSPRGPGRGWKKSRNASIKRQKKETLYLMWVEPVHSVGAEALAFCLWNGKVCL